MPSPTPALTPTKSDKPAGLTLEALKNAVYPVEAAAGKKVRLKDGHYQETIQPGAASKVVVTLHPIFVLGDLNGDGIGDAAVILVIETGGSGSFMSLVAVLNDQGQPKPAAGLTLGDRLKVESMSIGSGEISIAAVTHGPKDPMCCPTQKTVLHYALQGDQLVAR